MTYRLPWFAAAAAASCAFLLATARCASSDGGGDDAGCAPLDGACGAVACCAHSSRGDPLTCDADAGACVVQCLSARRDCTNAPDSCCPGYACQLDSFGYGSCQ